MDKSWRKFKVTNRDVWDATKEDAFSIPLMNIKNVIIGVVNEKYNGVDGGFLVSKIEIENQLFIRAIAFIEKYNKNACFHCINKDYEILVSDKSKIKDVIKYNRGVGAGGAKTNANGKSFESKTNNDSILIMNGFSEFNVGKMVYLSKSFNNLIIVSLRQKNFLKYCKEKYGIDCYRHPDDAYIIDKKDGKICIKIMEKKYQSTAGSAEEKLWAAPSFKQCYQMMFKDFNIDTCYTLNKYLLLIT